MTLDEAQKVAKIVAKADDGCPNCVRDLVDMANKAFPEFLFEYDGSDEGWQKENEDRVSVRPAG